MKKFMLGVLIIILGLSLGGCLESLKGEDGADGDISDESAVMLDRMLLEFDNFKGSNTTSTGITTDLSLPVLGSNGSTISWSSDNTSVIAIDGAVTRPANGSGDASVTLQATITKGSASETKEFGLTVLEEESEPVSGDIEMVLVPAGTTTSENGSITVLSDFYIGKYEVTQSEWETVMTGNSNSISATPSGFSNNPNNPVERVSWYDIMVFCNRLSTQEGLTPVYTISSSTNPGEWGTVPTSRNATWDAVTVNSSANGYRLPTDVEWEYAARGGKDGDATTYAGSNTVGDVAWYSNSGSTTPEVGTKTANELGLYDMSGNVWEWCYDWHLGYEGSYRVVRGGSWDGYGRHCAVSNRHYHNPYSRYRHIGFRVSRTF